LADCPGAAIGDRAAAGVEALIDDAGFETLERP
jgi:hypothetical protein